ncbi:MAG TPA: GatB/YqeY domain-containing protein [Gammaproteobacteria bacterium]|nr:GatB/YqeY domain-containing protein [Gammaproteobacteria bacterium]
MASNLKTRIQDDMKAAMRSKDSRRLGVIRMILAALKQKEVDERIELDDAQVITILGKMLKQRRDSLSQFESAGRQDLVDQEAYEISIVEAYLPPALDEGELTALIDEAIASSGASSARDMGKVMGLLKPRIQGRADMGQVSRMVKERLGA